MFTTYNEDPEIVRLSIQDAKAIRYPHSIDLRVHVLDDGRREAMKQVALEEGVGYISRSNNIGFKAGNLRNGLENTGGDFIVICDADTRPFSTLLERTLGYFRDPDVAWVQSPQWFYDIPEGTRLPDHLARCAGRIGPGVWQSGRGGLRQHSGRRGSVRKRPHHFLRRHSAPAELGERFLLLRRRLDSSPGSRHAGLIASLRRRGQHTRRPLRARSRRRGDTPGFGKCRSRGRWRSRRS